MKSKYIIWGAVAVGAYLIWKKMKESSSNPTGRDLAPPPVSRPPVDKPLPPRERPPVSKPAVQYVK